MEKHSNYSPSRLSRVIACPGSVELIENLMVTSTIQEEKPNVDAAHGTMLHKVMDKFYLGPGSHEVKALDGLELDDKALIEDAAEYVDLVYKGIRHSNYMVGSEMSVNL